MEPENNQDLHLFDCDLDINHFLYHHTNDIIDLFYNLKSHFKISSPFFLAKLKSENLTELIVISIFFEISDMDKKHFNQNFFNYFFDYYYSEIEISYKIFQKTLKTEKKITLNSWIYFCIINSDLYEVNGTR
jgi:hypothetical protein